MRGCTRRIWWTGASGVRKVRSRDLRPSPSGGRERRQPRVPNRRRSLRLRREVEVLQEKLRRAELVMDAQKKLSMALDALRSSPESNETSE